jgi:drug/metabolite transporter (DMT)-like permease
MSLDDSSSAAATAGASHLAMAGFVLLWGSAAIFTRWGLDHASPLAFLMLRFALALTVLLALAGSPRAWWPAPGTRWAVARAGALFVAAYSLCYFQAMERGVTPGLLATLLGAQPILTLQLTERSYAPRRLGGLLLALAGLSLVVWQSLAATRLAPDGLAFALAALACTTFGALQQKRIDQPPMRVLPLQFGVTLLMLALCIPFMPLRISWSWGFAVPLLWLGVVISVGAQLLLYRLIRRGNLVNVTSLLYLVPVVTVLLDALLLGNRLPALALLGMGAILGGMALVFKAPRPGKAL